MTHTHTKFARVSLAVGLRRRDAGRNSAAPATHARRAPIESPARRQSLFNPCDIYAHDGSGVVRDPTIWTLRENGKFFSMISTEIKYR